MTERRRPTLDVQPADATMRALSARIARLEARNAELGDSLSRLWTLFERRGGGIAPLATAPTPQRSLAPRLSASEAARLIGCDPRTIRRLVASGRLRGGAVQLAGDRKR